MKRLTKSSRQKMICGVCGGIAEYLNVDVTVVRLITVALILAAGSSLLAYIIAAIVMPNDDRVSRDGDSYTTYSSDPDEKRY